MGGKGFRSSLSAGRCRVLGRVDRTSGSSRKPYLESAWPVAFGNQDPWAPRQELLTHSSTWARHLRLDRRGHAKGEVKTFQLSAVMYSCSTSVAMSPDSSGKVRNLIFNCS